MRSLQSILPTGTSKEARKEKKDGGSKETGGKENNSRDEARSKENNRRKEVRYKEGCIRHEPYSYREEAH